MKKYYIRYWRDFANTFTLCYCETPEEEAAAVAAGFERITRKEAERKCSGERWARKNDPAFSGYGDIDIRPWRYIIDASNNNTNPDYYTHPGEDGLELHGYIWE